MVGVWRAGATARGGFRSVWRRGRYYSRGLAALATGGIVVVVGEGQARGQVAFETSPAVDLAVAAASWGAYGGLHLGVKAHVPPPECAVEMCGPRSDGARPYQRDWDMASYVPVALAIGGAMAPSVERWAIGDGTSRQAGDAALMLAQALGVTGLITESVKLSAPRFRPYLAFGPSPDDRSRTDAEASASFWSAHTAMAFAAAAVGSFDACRVRSDLGCVGPAVGLHALGVATGVSRVVAGMHHISDVIVGAVAGSAVGSAVALLHAPGGREKGKPAAHAMIGSDVVMLSVGWVW